MRRRRRDRFSDDQCPLGVRLWDVFASARLKKVRFAGTSEAAEGTRTLDLLHGKQLLNRGFPLSMRIRGVGDSRGLPAITVDSGNELVMAHVAVRGFRPQREPIYFVETVRLGRHAASASRSPGRETVV
jgi:hypothetical protein